jgi:SAM-dependent methyltransferase
MKQTPIHDQFNPDVLALMPAKAARVVEVGCSSGALARAYLKDNPGCDYTGIEIEPEYASVARAACTRVVSANIERMEDSLYASLFPSDCWVFGDVLEHLYDSWAVLQRLRRSLSRDASVVACIPNSQHWSMQARLNSGLLRYDNAGLLDRTHIRWFTKTTIVELFASTGFRIVDGRGGIFPEPQRDGALAGSGRWPKRWGSTRRKR